MKCDFCDQTASVFLTKVSDGVVQKLRLCRACAEAQGVSDSDGLSVSDIFENFPDIGDETPVTIPGGTGQTTCPACGFTGEDLRKTGRLGCPECYGVFRNAVTRNLKEMHKGGESHKGRVPPQFLTTRLESDLEDCEDRLRSAVSTESFEEAAKYRDRIAEIKRQLSSLSALAD